MLAAQICMRASLGCPQAALEHQHRHVLAGWLPPAAGGGGTPGRGCQKERQARPGQGKELIPLLAGSQMAAALFPCLAD